MKKGVKVSLIQAFIIFLSLCLGILFFMQCEMDADMAGSIVATYKQDQYLGKSFEWTNLKSYDPWNIVSWISYNIFGISEDAVKLITTIFYIFCVTIIFELCIDDYRVQDILALLLMTFMLVPGVSANKYHYASTIAILATLLYIKKRKYHKKRLVFFDVLFLTFFCLWLFITADKLLIILNIFCPLVIYGFYKMLITRKYHRWLTLLLAVGAFILMCSAFIWQNVSLSLYGVGEYYLVWADLSEMWNPGIEFLLKTIARAMNINATGVVVQPMSIIWMIKMIMIILAVGELSVRVKQALAAKQENIFWVITCGAVTLSTVFYLINGRRIGLYQEYGYSYSYCGYMGCVWFLLPLLSVEGIKRICNKFCLIEQKWNVYLLFVSLCFLIVITVFPTLDIFKTDYQNINKQVADYVQEIGAEGGIAVYDPSYTVTTWSEGDFYSVGYVNWNIDDESQWGYRRLDTYIEWKTNDIGEPEDIEESLDKMAIDKYGVWREKVKFYEDPSRTSESDYPQERIVYYYNRDIRWPQRVLDASMLRDNVYSVFLPLGENRVCLSGNHLTGIELNFIDENGQPLDFIIEYAMDTQISYLVYADTNSNVNICLKNNQISPETSFSTIVLEVNRAAICIGENISLTEVDSEEISMVAPKGEYLVIMTGDELGKIDLSVKDGDGEVKVVQDGNGRKIFACTIYNDMAELVVHNQNNRRVVLDKVYYELPNEEKQQMIEYVKMLDN